jgi:hypothetical protein
VRHIVSRFQILFVRLLKEFNMKKIGINRIVYLVMTLLNVQLAHAQSPGNVGTTNLTAWFNPDNLPLGNATSWTTTFPSGSSALTLTDAVAPYPTVTNNPIGGIFNYNKTISFVGNTVAAPMSLELPGTLNLLNNNTSTSQGTLFAVYYMNTTAAAAQQVVDYRESGGDAIQLRWLTASTSRLALGTSNSVNGTRDYSEGVGPMLISYSGNKSGAATLKCRKRSLEWTNNPVSSSASTAPQLGLTVGSRKNTSAVYSGMNESYISELIFFNTDLGFNDNLKVESYLAVKYGITLDPTGLSVGNYLASTSSTIWNAFGNLGYHNDVIGIGRDDNSLLNQKQSHTFTDSTRMYIGTLASTNDVNASTFTNDVSYIMMGSNLGSRNETATASAEIPSSQNIAGRIEREWRVTNTNMANAFSIDITLANFTNFSSNPSNLCLLIDDDGDFTNAIVVQTSVSFSVNGNTITVSGINASHIPSNSTKFITLGYINSFSTPVAGTTVSTSTSVCEGESFTLSLSGASNFIGQIYQWESSPNNTVYTPIIGANSSTFLTSNTASTYYRCVVTLGPNSSTSTNLLITVNPLPTFSTFASTNISCSGSANGSIVVASAAPSPVFSINPISTQAPIGTFAGLAANTYTVTVLDGNTCSATSSVTLSEPTALTVGLTSLPFCTGGNTTINSTVSGGTSGYTYQWISGVTTNTVTLNANKDNTIFQDLTGNSNGAGANFSAGNDGSNSPRRALIAFDFSSIPSGATITGVNLNLNCSQTSGSAGAQVQTLHLLTSDWGEGTSSGSGGTGAAATTNDATWLLAFHPSTTWGTSGGDFAISPSASTTVNAVGPYTWSSTTMVSDVQNWIVNPASNFGWLIKGTETAAFQAKRYDSRENPTVANRPTLEVNYNTPIIAGNGTSLPNATAGTYTLVVTDANGCTSSSVITLTPDPTPTVTVSALPITATVCEGESVTLSGNGATSYSWTGGVIDNTSFTPLATTTYTVTGTSLGCSATTSITVTVNNLPTVTATPTTQTVCENASATLTGGGASTYVWSGGITDATPFVVTNGPTTYTVTGTDGSGCSNTATAVVNMNAAPIVTASATPSTTCNNSTVTPMGGGASTYAWSGGLTDNTPFVATTGTTTYTVTGTDGIGCTATSTVSVTVNAASGMLASATSNQAQNQADDFSLSYYDPSCNLIASIDDIIGGNVLGLTTASVNVDANAGVHNGQPFVRRWYQITPSNNVGVSASVTLYIDQADFTNYNNTVASPYLPMPTSGNNSDPNITNIRITKNSDAGLGNNPEVIIPNVFWNGNFWELNFTVAGFSQFRVHSANPGNTPLPATITKFNGRKLNSSDMLEWTTASEQNNAYFNLQHSTNGVDFKTIAKVNSKAQNGNSQTELNYGFEHTTPSLGHNYYRLEQVDIDNQSTINAKIVDIIWGADGSTVSMYPNPTQDVLNIDLYTSKVQNTTVKVLDMSGRVVKQIQARSEAGMNKLNISLADLAKGIYTVQIYENNALAHMSKIVKSTHE